MVCCHQIEDVASAVCSYTLKRLISQCQLFQLRLLCYVSVVVGWDVDVDDALNESPADDVRMTDDKIVSQWREVSADERSKMCEQFDEVLRPFGLETSLVVVKRAN